MESPEFSRQENKVDWEGKEPAKDPAFPSTGSRYVGCGGGLWNPSLGRRSNGRGKSHGVQLKMSKSHQMTMEKTVSLHFLPGRLGPLYPP